MNSDIDSYTLRNLATDFAISIASEIAGPFEIELPEPLFALMERIAEATERIAECLETKEISSGAVDSDTKMQASPAIREHSVESTSR